MKTAAEFLKEKEELIKMDKQKKEDECQLNRIEEFLDKQKIDKDTTCFVFPEIIRDKNVKELEKAGYTILYRNDNKSTICLESCFVDYDISKHSKDSRIDDVYNRKTINTDKKNINNDKKEQKEAINDLLDTIYSMFNN